MSTYVIVLNEPSEYAWNALDINWPNHHLILNEYVAFVAPEGISITEDVSKVIGVHPENPEALGVIFEAGNYYSFNMPRILEWIRKAHG